MPRCCRRTALGAMGSCAHFRGGGDRRLWLDEAAADGVARQLDAVAHAELLEDVRAVTLDGLLADEQQVGDLLVGVGLGDQLDDLLLARRERVGMTGPALP